MFKLGAPKLLASSILQAYASPKAPPCKKKSCPHEQRTPVHLWFGRWRSSCPE